jgi:hypothetical protein
MKSGFYFAILAPMLVVSPVYGQEGGFFGGYLGEYRAELNIGYQILADRLSITRITRHPGMLNAREEMEGHYTVPSAFTSAIEKAVIEVGGSSNQLVQISFTFLAKEPPRPYPVHVRLTGVLYDLCDIRGVAFAEADGIAKILGDIKLIKTTCEVKSGGP